MPNKLLIAVTIVIWAVAIAGWLAARTPQRTIDDQRPALAESAIINSQGRMVSPPAVAHPSETASSDRPAASFEALLQNLEKTSRPPAPLPTDTTNQSAPVSPPRRDANSNGCYRAVLVEQHGSELWFDNGKKVIIASNELVGQTLDELLVCPAKIFNLSYRKRLDREEQMILFSILSR